jgi:Rap1a immunity proteins
MTRCRGFLAVLAWPQLSHRWDDQDSYGTPERVASAFYCIAYIAGVNDAFNITAGGKSCVPTGVTMGQLRDVILRYLQ